MIVNARNPLATISIDQIGSLLQSEDMRWQAMGGNREVVNCYAEGGKSWSRNLVRLRCMGFSEQGDGYTTHGYRPFREDMVECFDAAEVIRKVARDPQGIGFLQYYNQDLKGAKLLTISDSPDAEPVSLREGLFVQREYPLAEPLLLYLHPDAPPLARAFCEFAVSPAGAAIAAKQEIITPVAQAAYEGELRIARMKQGQGVPISAAGTTQATALMNALAMDYVRRESLIQLKYSGQKELWAVNEFLRGGELLILTMPIDKMDLKAAKPKWDELARPRVKVGHQRAMTDPIEEHIVAARAVAIVVHSLNRIDALTLDQVKAIFTGQVKDWRILAAFDASHDGATAIQCYGTDQSDPSFELFYQLADHRDFGRRLERKRDSQEVMSALSMDVNGIAFVDAAALPRDLDKRGIKLLGISDGDTMHYPTVAAALDGGYPPCATIDFAYRALQA